MPDCAAKTLRVYQDIGAAFKYCRALGRAVPIVLFFSPCLDALPQKELDSDTLKEHRVVAIVNTEKPSWWAETSPAQKWDYGAHVQNLIAHPRVEAVILRTKTNVRDGIAHNVGMYVFGHLYPPELIESHANDVTALPRDFVLLTFGIRPKCAIFSDSNSRLSYSIKIHLNLCYFYSKRLTTVWNDTFKRGAMPSNVEKGSDVYEQYTLARAHHYDYIRTEYINTNSVWVCGWYLPVIYDTSALSNSNIYEYHPYFNMPRVFFYSELFCTAFLKIESFLDFNIRFTIHRGLGEFMFTEHKEAIKLGKYALPRWFAPDLTLQSVQSFRVPYAESNKDQPASNENYMLYEVHGDTVLRFRVVRKADLKWE